MRSDPSFLNRQSVFRSLQSAALLLVFATTCHFATAAQPPGTIYLVMGSDTAIWNAGTTVDVYTRYPYYRQNSFTDPGTPSYKVMDPAWRAQYTDFYGQQIKFTWWMMGGNIFRDATNLNVPIANTMTLYLMKKYHGDAIRQFGDELSLHYHTFLWSDYNGDGKYFWNQSRTFNECRSDFDFTLAQYLLEEEVFPVSFRSGWHYMDNDWQSYLNQLLPYCLHDDYGVYRAWSSVVEPIAGAEDWSHAPSAFVPFHPSTNDYQVPGNGAGWNTRSVKMQNVTQTLINQIFAQAASGTDQVACIWDHLPENFVTNVDRVESFISQAASHNRTVPFRYCTAVEAMQRWRGVTNLPPPQIDVQENIQGQIVTLTITTSEPIFQPQPFVALRDAFRQYTSLVCVPAGSNTWSLVLPVPLDNLAKVGIAATDLAGNLATRIVRFLPDDLYVDNLDPVYAELQGNWSSTTNAAWGTDARIARLASNDTARVQWSLPISSSGPYNISVQVPPLANAASNVQFTLFAGVSNLSSTLFPTALPTNQWVFLFSPFLDQSRSNTLEMVVSGTNQPGAYAVADVVRLLPLPNSNSPPVAFDRGAATTKNTALVLPVTNILGNDFDPDNDPLTLTVSSTSLNGGTITQSQDLVTYVPPSDFIGMDSFGYSINDGRGGTASATVQILVLNCCLPAPNQLSISPQTNGFLLRFAGQSGQTCQIQRSTDLSAPWTTIAIATLPMVGILEYTDTNAPPGTAFYRIGNP